MRKDKDTTELRRCLVCNCVASSEHICEDLRQDAERAHVARDNAIALTELMQQYNILIPARSIHLWRPTLRVSGDIDGVRDGLEIIATDGLLGWFVTYEGEAWCGHIRHFSGDVKPLFSVTPKDGQKKPKSLRKKSRRQIILDTL